MPRRTPDPVPTRLPSRAFFALVLALAAMACGPNHSGGGDGGRDGGIGDGGRDGGTDGGTVGDGRDPAPVACDNPPIPAPADGACSVTKGTGGSVLIRGDVLTEDGELDDGEVLVASDGKILCAACGCEDKAEATGATVIACPDAVVSPGLINTHDHITYTGDPPYDTSERYDQRHDWRKGLRNHHKISAPSTPGAQALGELRQLMSGTTSLVGSGGVHGFLRNLDGSATLQEGLAHPSVDFDTFPLGDSSGTQLTSGCAYPGIVSPDDPKLVASSAYEPHVAEGIDDVAHNEFLCLTSTDNGGHDLALPKSAFIHAIGLTAADYALMAQKHVALIWSPRSNVSLYGETAQVTTAARLGVRIALGTDWTRSGSVNLLRELKCADGLNQEFYGRFFSDKELFDMATITAAKITGTDDALGSLAPGKWADLAIYAAHGQKDGWRAVLDADVPDTLLVLRGGTVMYGEPALVDALGSTGCESLSVCGSDREICVQREYQKSLADVVAGAGTGAYPLFFCGPPDGEPSCVPTRPDEFTGQSTPDDRDGDGIPDAEDDCPDVFNPVRPLDHGRQADTDGDGVGDACDVCPLAPDVDDPTQCPPVPSDDKDFDGVPDGVDNCPDASNPDQADADHDGHGDACDACPNSANPGTDACPFSIYDLKTVPAGTRARVPDGEVTAVTADGFFMQHVPGDALYDPTKGPDGSGIYVFTKSSALTPPPVGAHVQVVGTTGDYFGRIELDAPESVDVLSTGAPPPDPVLVRPQEIVAGGARAQSLESVLVRVEGATVTDVNPPVALGETAPTNEYAIDAGLEVDDLLYLTDPFPQLGEALPFVEGLLRLANGATKLEPRDADDVGRRPYLAALQPGEVYVPVNASSSISVVLSQPLGVDAMVFVSSADPRLVVPAFVTVPAGEPSVEVPLTATAPTGGPVTLSATWDGVTRTAKAVGYDPAAPRALVDFSASTAGLPAGVDALLTGTLDGPAPDGGLSIPLAVDPAGVLQLSAEALEFAAGDVTASVGANYLAQGAATVSASWNGVTRTVDLSGCSGSCAGANGCRGVLVCQPGSAPACRVADSCAPHLVVSQLGTGTAASGNAKFVELYNPSAMDVDASQVGLYYRSAGGTSAPIALYAFPQGATVPAGGFFLVASSQYKDDPAHNPVAPDASTSSGMVAGSGGQVWLMQAGSVPSATVTPADPGVLDMVGYGSASAHEGSAAPAPPKDGALVRKAFAASTATTMATGGADELEGDGQDSNDNGADFVVVPARRPRNSQSAPEP